MLQLSQNESTVIVRFAHGNCQSLSDHSLVRSAFRVSIQLR